MHLSFDPWTSSVPHANRIKHTRCNNFNLKIKQEKIGEEEEKKEEEEEEEGKKEEEV